MTRGGIFTLSMLLITLIFFVLKMCGAFEAPWVWVFCPIWIPLGEILLSACIATLIRGFDSSKKKEKKDGE